MNGVVVDHAHRAIMKADAAFTDLSAAMKFAREQATSLVNLERAALADRTLTHEGALLQIANAAPKSGERVAMRLDAARAKAKAEIDGIAKRTASPPSLKDAVGLGLEQETRARLASMPEKERRDAVARAFSGGGAARTRDAGRDGPPIAQPLLAPSACQPYCG